MTENQSKVGNSHVHLTGGFGKVVNTLGSTSLPATSSVCLKLRESHRQSPDYTAHRDRVREYSENGDLAASASQPAQLCSMAREQSAHLWSGDSAPASTPQLRDRCTTTHLRAKLGWHTLPILKLSIDPTEM